MNNSLTLGKARSWYLKAQRLWPKSGRAYNQLAILATYVHRKLDAVFYYMRSLATSTPFPSARESLAQVFEEVRKKVAERKRAEQEGATVRQLARQDSRGRHEIWLHQDGSRGGAGPDLEGVSVLEQLSVVESGFST
ncbi:PREDICTED: telomerase-binding protein EST1A-like [Priapulus caudatus]|uniref:Telomerase-binding protein EST1A-like n=1 Tax=Priapulus caudatus TaxID=37621 RepID=A0ABM1F375_PRICU|nr:PREDICTED: telomerase-binding protein EST1A-like [Priapulus caudatus]